ncbi:MAG TPA: hypothetical protein VFK48_02720 [Usitatibacter sp.]|nr:hypothetical protein [Usitatibacter sp.]
MDPVASIRRLGFRKWYERELIKCHAALVTCFLCGLTVAALMEQVHFMEGGWRPVGMIAIVVAAGALGVISWRSYITVLQRAEYYGESSSCPECHAYGRFEVLESGLDSHPSGVAASVRPLESAWMRVKCRKCGAAWRMPD